MTASAGDPTAADLVVIGAGLAGLTVALSLAPRPVLVLSKAPLGQAAASLWAQGGIAAAVGADDSPAQHAADTIAVAGGLADPGIVDLVTRDGPSAIAWLESLGIRFDRIGGDFALGREAGHSRRRIVHITGDGTGRAVMAGVIEAVATCPSITVRHGAAAEEILVEDGRAVGVVVRDQDRLTTIRTGGVVIATGGIGQLYRYTTNPKSAWADGLALGAHAGARLVDLEFVQYHPTALDVGLDPMPLATEALRGEGAWLIDETGHRFMPELHRDAELAPRDVVSRAIWRTRDAGHRTFLDCRAVIGDRFQSRFPTVYGYCRAAGIDPIAEPIPVATAVHYHMGGIAVDATGRSSIERLWVCGETASTGLHGANRLASNSLLEAVVFGRRVASDLSQDWHAAPGRIAFADRQTVPLFDPERASWLRDLMDRRVGVVRDEAGLTEALGRIAQAALTAPAYGPERNALTVARLIATAALARRESLGAHFRRDFPTASDQAKRRFLTLDEAAFPAPERIPS